MAEPSDFEAREFASSFQRFLEWVRSEGDGSRHRNEVVALVAGFLGDAALGA